MFNKETLSKGFYLFIFFCCIAHSFWTGVLDIRYPLEKKLNINKIINKIETQFEFFKRLNINKIEAQSEYFKRINKPTNEIIISNISDMLLNVMKYTPYVVFFITKNPAIIPVYSISIAASSTICYFVKKITKETRPDDQNSKDSFPSGHTTIAFTSFICIWLIFKRYSFGKTLNIFMFLTALMTAICRVLCHRHWVLDVCCGGVIGICIGYLAYYFYVIKRKI